MVLCLDYHSVNPIRDGHLTPQGAADPALFLSRRITTTCWEVFHAVKLVAKLIFAVCPRDFLLLLFRWCIHMGNIGLSLLRLFLGVNICLKSCSNLLTHIEVKSNWVDHWRRQNFLLLFFRESSTEKHVCGTLHCSLYSVEWKHIYQRKACYFKLFWN